MIGTRNDDGIPDLAYSLALARDDRRSSCSGPRPLACGATARPGEASPIRLIFFSIPLTKWSNRLHFRNPTQFWL